MTTYLGVFEFARDTVVVVFDETLSVVVHPTRPAHDVVQTGRHLVP